MISTPRISRVAVLKCVTFGNHIADIRGQFENLFYDLLAPATARLNEHTTRPPVQLEVIGYDVVKGDYPPSLYVIDAIVVTGSLTSTHNDLSWISTLENYIRGELS
jgi:hypothetical protein